MAVHFGCFSAPRIRRVPGFFRRQAHLALNCVWMDARLHAPTKEATLTVPGARCCWAAEHTRYTTMHECVAVHHITHTCDIKQQTPDHPQGKHPANPPQHPDNHRDQFIKKHSSARKSPWIRINACVPITSHFLVAWSAELGATDPTQPGPSHDLFTQIKSTSTRLGQQMGRGHRQLRYIRNNTQPRRTATHGSEPSERRASNRVRQRPRITVVHDNDQRLHPLGRE